MIGRRETKNKIIAIIPARGGSKGIPRKNIKLLDGKPLIAYSIEAALTSKIDKVIVSTEDEEIAEISRKYCAEVIEGPKELAKDETSTIDALKHVIGALREKDNYRPAISFFYTSYPTKKVVDIINAIDFFKNNDCESVVRVSETNPYWRKIGNEQPTFIIAEKFINYNPWNWNTKILKLN